MELHLYIFRI